MQLTRLHIHHLRNITQLTATFHPRFNILIGKNGSGKTTLLEAITLLALGRSFRTRQVHSLISYHQQAFACFGEIRNEEGQIIPLGIEKTRVGEVRCKVAGEKCAQLSQFARLLPVQLITPDTFKLLVAGPEERRRFLDWGVFHVEHPFAELCQRYQRLLKQRNAALKQAIKRQQLSIWEQDLAQTGEKIHHLRYHYFNQFLSHWAELQPAISAEQPVTLQYCSGWAPEGSLAEALQQNYRFDQRVGYTSAGPHRAEIAMQIAGLPAHQVLSRGQQKSVVCALHIAQAQYLAKVTQKKCVYLVDDLAAEFDEHNQTNILNRLAADTHQVFFTSIHPAFAEIAQHYAPSSAFLLEKGGLNTLFTTAQPDYS